MGGASSSSGENKTAAAAAAAAGAPVILHVYQPADKQTSAPGFRPWHTGVEVYECEYVFGGVGKLTGIYEQRPKFIPKDFPWEYHSSITIANTKLSKADVKELIKQMKSEYPANTYHLTKRNCNHFSDDFCRRLTNTGIPGWVNRLAASANAVQSVVGDIDFDKMKQEPQSKLNMESAQSSSIDVDLLSEIDTAQLACLNCKNKKALARVFEDRSEKFNPKAEVLESDADEQLLIFIPFKRNVNVRELVLRCPKTIKLFQNKKNIDFSDVSKTAPSHVCNFSAELQNAGPEKDLFFPLVFSKFTNTRFLTLFVESNFGKPTSVINRIALVGRCA